MGCRRTERLGNIDPRVSAGANMTIITYVDDTSAELDRYAKRLRTADVKVTALLPPTPFDPDMITATRADVYVIDYELEKVTKTYEGATLATAIRERLPEHPIVLLSKRSLVVPSRTRPLSLLFDDIVFKDELDKHPTTVRSRIVALADAFAELRRKRRRDVRAVLTVLRARKEEAPEILRVTPPLDVVSDGAQWEVRSLGEWIRRELLAYPGVLYDALHAATVLGVDVSAFRSISGQGLFDDAAYGGVFAAVDDRWWRSRLLVTAQELIAKSAVQPGPAHITFPNAFHKLHGERLRRSVCVYCGEHGPDAVCYVLRQPVHTEHSLAYRPDARPAAMDEARVSFKAIRETDDVIDEYLDERSREIAEQVRNE
jgi:hypothetical protein